MIANNAKYAVIMALCVRLQVLVVLLVEEESLYVFFTPT